MPTDRVILNDAVAGLIGGSFETAADPLAGGEPSNATTGAGREIQRRTFRIAKLAADPAAGDATTNGICNATFSLQTMVPHKSKLVGVKICPLAALTSNNSNLATINITKDNGGGGAQTAIFSANTATSAAGGTGSWSTGQYINATSFIRTASDAHVCAAGSYIQLQIAKGASGVVVPVMTLELVFEEV